MEYKTIEESACNGGCSREEALWAVANLSAEELCSITGSLREEQFGKEIALCIIMNARCGCCSEDCVYCSQSAHNSADITVFELKDNKEISGCAGQAGKYGAENFGIVTSGATVVGADLEQVCRGMGALADTVGIPAICASFGRMSREQLAQLKTAGLRRYHHNLETSERFYPQICTTHNWSERVGTVRNALALGLDVCSGGLFGLGENWEDRASLALVLKDLGVDSIPLNFLHSHPGTPLAGQEPLSAEEALRIIALFRLILPTRTIRVCGGRPKILGDRMREMFRYGANAFMTGDYLTTAGITPESDQELILAEGLIIA